MFIQSANMVSDGLPAAILYDQRSETYSVRNLSTNKLEALPKQEFHKRLSSGRIRPPKSTKIDPDRSEQLDMDISSFRDKDVKEGLRRADYARAIIQRGEPSPQSTAWQPEIEAIAIAKGEDLRRNYAGLDKAERKRRRKATKLMLEPDWRTVAEWVRLYKEANFNFIVLIPLHVKKGRAVQSRSDQEKAVIQEFVNEYLTMERPVPALLYDNMKARYHREKKNDAKKSGWRLMSRSSFYAMLARLDEYEVTRRRYGPEAAKSMFMHGGKGPVAEHPLDVVEVDATVADCDVWNDEMTAVIGRPWVYVAIDRCTRMVVGIYIGFEPPSTYSLLQCVRCGVLPKDLRSQYPDIPVTWDVMGSWQVMVTDNSKEALGNSLKSVIGKLGTEHRLAPVKTPQFKGIVERFNKTFNENGVARLPGKTYGNVVERDKYVSSKSAVLTISEFRYFVHYWLLVDYCYAWHEGVGAVPALLWDDRIKGYQPRIPEGIEDIAGVFGELHTATLSKTGLVFLGLDYNSTYLEDIHYKYGGIELSFKVDPVDLGFIYVIDPDTKRLCPVPCDDPAYASGLTLHQHKKIRALAKANETNWENSEIRLEMRADFIAWTEKLVADAKSKAKRARARAAGQGVVQPSLWRSGEDALKRQLDKARSKPVGENPFARKAAQDPFEADAVGQSTEIDYSDFQVFKGDQHAAQ